MLAFLSAVCGVLYVAIWSALYYPTLWQNQRTLDAARTSGYAPKGGLSLDYLAINIFGYVIYLDVICLQLFHERTREQLAEQAGSSSGSLVSLVDRFDFMFYLHGLALNCLLLYQVFALAHATRHSRVELGERKTTQRRSWLPRLSPLATGLLAAGAATFLLAYRRYVVQNDNYIAFIWAVLMVKVCCLLFKFVPQVVLNTRTRTMNGLLIHGIRLDMLGSAFCWTQMVILAYRLAATRTSHPTVGSVLAVFMENRGKVAILLVGVVYNLIFVSQHYAWGGDEKEVKAG